MGDVGVKTALAHLLVAAGALCIVAAVWLLACGAWALLVAGILAMVYGLLLVDVPAKTVVAPVPGDATRAGR